MGKFRSGKRKPMIRRACSLQDTNARRISGRHGAKLLDVAERRTGSVISVTESFRESGHYRSVNGHTHAGASMNGTCTETIDREMTELRGDELVNVVGGSSSISVVINALGEALRRAASGGGEDPPATTNSVRGTGGQFGP
jgi:hypothetical protein